MSVFFCVRLYTTYDIHKVPSMDDITDKTKCLLGLKASKKWRSTYPVACVIGYESVIQIKVGILIGWDKKKRCGESDIFGISLAYNDCCEERARYILYSHISVWIKDVDKLRNLLYDTDENIRLSAKSELES